MVRDVKTLGDRGRGGVKGADGSALGSMMIVVLDSVEGDLNITFNRNLLDE